MQAWLVRFVVVLTLGLVATPILAQELPSGDTRNAYFTQHFQRIVALNGGVNTDFMKMPIGTVYRLPDGNTDELVAGDTKGIWGREFQKFYGYSYEKFLQGQDPPPTTPAPALQPERIVETVVVNKTPWWAWVLLVVALLLLWMLWNSYRKWRDDQNTKRVLSAHNDSLAMELARAQQEQELNRNPVTSGPPMIPNGVTPATANAALQQVAARHYHRETGLTPTSTTMFEIIERVRGRGYGVVGVTYRGVPAEDRRLNGEQMYQATVRYPDGNTRQVWMLEGCGNDLIYRGAHYTAGDQFRFVPDATQPEASAPVAAPASPVASQPVAPVASAPQGATSSARSPHNRMMTVPDDGAIRLTIKNAGPEGPALVWVSGLQAVNEPSVVIGQNSFEFRFTPSK